MTYFNENIDENSILVFEYFTGSGDRTPCIISEAEALILALLEDLKDLDVYLLINESYEYLVKDNKNITPIFISESLEDWLNTNSSKFKKAMFISAENDMNLYNLTKILEDNGVNIYNSSSNASYICSDKYEMYEQLYDIVPQPRTFKLKIDKVGYWKRAIENLYKSWQSEDPLNPLKMIIKPINGVDCENIKVINDINDFNYDLEELFPVGSRILVQEYIEGEDYSVSLISDGNKAIPLSLNSQEIKLTENHGIYLGGETPVDSDFKDEAFQIAKDAVEAIDGIKGFVGVDIKINKDAYDYNVVLLEINSRFTTPYVGLQKIAKFSIGKLIINLLENNENINKITDEISFNGTVYFKKDGDNLKIEEKL